MKIYFDTHCRICRHIAAFCQSHSKEPLVFIAIHDSIYSTYEKATIVVYLDGTTYTYGAALRMIFRRMSYPYSLFSYIPIRALDSIYRILRYMRRYL